MSSWNTRLALPRVTSEWHLCCESHFSVTIFRSSSEAFDCSLFLSSSYCDTGSSRLNSHISGHSIPLLTWQKLTEHPPPAGDGNLRCALKGLTAGSAASVRACMLHRFSRVRLSATPWTAAHQAPLFLGFSRQEYWTGLPCLLRRSSRPREQTSGSYISSTGRRVLYHQRHHPVLKH